MMGKSKSNASLLVKAAEVGDAAQVALLLSEEGIRVNHKEIGEDATPLGKAAFQGHGEVVKLLLDAGADVLATDDTYLTPLHAALERGHSSVVQLLLAPSVAARSDDTTILHWMAAAEARLEHVQCVVQAGGDATAKDDEGRLAWEWAAEESEGRDGVVAVFLREAAERQAERDTTDREQREDGGGGAGGGARIRVVLQRSGEEEKLESSSSYLASWSLDVMGGEWVRNCCVNLGVDPDTHRGRTRNVQVFLCAQRGSHQDCEASNGNGGGGGGAAAVAAAADTDDAAATLGKVSSSEWVYWKNGATQSIGQLGLRDGDTAVFRLLPETGDRR